MTRQLSLGCLLLLTHFTFAQGKQQPVTSKIERVTVFTKGAQTTRKAKTAIAAGKTELVFTSLSPSLDAQSVQVRGEGAFTILSVVYRLNSITENRRTDDLTGLDAQRLTLRRRIQTEQKLLEVFKNEEKILKENQNVGTVSVGVKTADLKELADFQRTRLTEVLMKQLEIEARIQQADSTIKRIDQRIQNYTAPREIPTGEVVVTVQAKEPTSGTFELSYYVPNASWFPNYDVRVKDVNSPIDLALKANISQQSGEDWRDVRLTISTGNPNEGSVAPTLQAWNLGFGYPQTASFNAAVNGAITGQVRDRGDSSPIPGVSVQVKGTSLGTNTDANGNYSILLPKGSTRLLFSYVGYKSEEITVNSNTINALLSQDAKALQEVVVAGYGASDRLQGRMPGVAITNAKPKPATVPLEVAETYQPTTTSYDIDEPYTVLTDGKVYTADLKAFSIPADYEYVAVPKLDRDAFLTARIPDWKDLNLIEGEAKLFFEGAYLGKTLLDVRNATDTLTLSLGRDKGIVVERKRMKNEASTNFMGDRRVANRGFEINVRNNKRQPVKLVVRDQFPHPTDKDIVVDDTEAPDAEVDKETRLVVWKYELPAKQARKHTLRYRVKYPKEEVVVLE